MPALVERPKMSLAMWAALKSHIMKQREKKKQEQEADAAVERLRREQEIKRKQDAMTLEEIKDQLVHYEKKLNSLNVEKHELFLYLKRVLNEDEKRRSEEDKEANELLHAGHPYSNQGIPASAASNLYMMRSSNTMMSRTPVMYKIGTAPQQNVISSGAIKRPRSPSPPNPGYQQGYGYKAHAASYGQKPTSYANAQNPGYYPHSTATATGTSSAVVVTNSTPYSTYPVPHPSAQYTPQDQKHMQAAYHVSHLQQQGYVGSIHQQMEHSNPKSSMQEEKYYLQPSGGISSGYPVRGQPPPSSSRFQPPTSLSVVAPTQVPNRKDEVLRRNLGNETHR